MRNRKLLLLGLAACLALLIVAVLRLSIASQHQILNRGVSRESYEAIQTGRMTEQDVEHLLGVPAGDYTTVEANWHHDGPADRPTWLRKRARWVTDACYIELDFDERGIAMRKSFGSEAPIGSKSIFKALCELLPF